MLYRIALRLGRVFLRGKHFLTLGRDYAQDHVIPRLCLHIDAPIRPPPHPHLALTPPRGRYSDRGAHFRSCGGSFADKGRSGCVAFACGSLIGLDVCFAHWARIKLGPRARARLLISRGPYRGRSKPPEGWPRYARGGRDSAA